MKKTLLCLLLTILPLTALAKTLFVSPNGNDNAPGTRQSPLATLPAACRLIESGDTVYFRGGTYHITDTQVMRPDRWLSVVFLLDKGGTENARTCFMGYPGERPVFDFSALQMDGRCRFSAFFLGADWLHLRNFDIVGVPVRVKGHTQSECISARRGSHCIIENIAMHDGMAIGYYQTEGAYNLVLNCDAYNNYDDYSEGPYGGNTDGFGFHLASPRDVGNVIRNCRAWRNSDDGFDLIHCAAPVEIDHCWAFFNGFKATADAYDLTTFERAGDGNGFKAGGWGMKKQRTKCPTPCPQHYIHHCIAYHNKANGIYANHQLGGNLWEHNVAALNNRNNFDMVNRKGSSAEDCIDVDGYGHTLRGNISWLPGKDHLGHCDLKQCTLTDNSFGPKKHDVDSTWFEATDPQMLFTPRDKRGYLPDTPFLQPRPKNAAPSGLSQLLFSKYWTAESESDDYRIAFSGDTCEITAPLGLSLWRKEKMKAGQTVEYDVLVTDDRLSDMNFFWLASDPEKKDVWKNMKWRHGIFARCYTLQTYYLGYGGNSNRTTRFRRYTGNKAAVDNKAQRPTILQEYTDEDHLLKSGHWYHVKITGEAGHLTVYVDGRNVVDYADPTPLTEGWFAFRTTHSRVKITGFRCY